MHEIDLLKQEHWDSRSNANRKGNTPITDTKSKEFGILSEDDYKTALGIIVNKNKELSKKIGELEVEVDYGNHLYEIKCNEVNQYAHRVDEQSTLITMLSEEVQNRDALVEALQSTIADKYEEINNLVVKLEEVGVLYDELNKFYKEESDENEKLLIENGRLTCELEQLKEKYNKSLAIISKRENSAKDMLDIVKTKLLDVIDIIKSKEAKLILQDILEMEV